MALVFFCVCACCLGNILPVVSTKALFCDSLYGDGNLINLLIRRPPTPVTGVEPTFTYAQPVRLRSNPHVHLNFYGPRRKYLLFFYHEPVELKLYMKSLCAKLEVIKTTFFSACIVCNHLHSAVFQDFTLCYNN